MERKIGSIDWRGRRAEVRVEVTLERVGETRYKLSICGSIWRRGAGDCDTCGQILDTLRDAQWTEGPTVDLPRLLAIWERWHLNDMRAGCEHQRAEKWNERRIDVSKPIDSYITWEAMDGREVQSWNMLTWATRSDHQMGLLGYPCSICGYKYGTAWLYEDLPEDVVAWARAFNEGQ